VYCPYNFISGVAQKAHAIILDPTSGNESISIVHADGMAITMNDIGELVLKNNSGDAVIRLDGNGITMTASKIVLNGGVSVGSALTAIPFAGGPAMPPSTLFSYSP
jgi:hypothetical protein